MGQRVDAQSGSSDSINLSRDNQMSSIGEEIALLNALSEALLVLNKERFRLDGRKQRDNEGLQSQLVVLPVPMALFLH